jgi:hypothetical protein
MTHSLNRTEVKDQNCCDHGNLKRLSFRVLQWSVRFPENEEVLAIALGPSYIAAATSLGLLRIFSLAGVQVRSTLLTDLSLPAGLSHEEVAPKRAARKSTSF